MNDPFADDPTNPFADTQPATAVPAESVSLVDDDDFGLATDEFIRLEDLDGRLLLVIPLGTPRTAKGSNGDPYSYLTCDIVVLSGRPTDKLPKVPGIYGDVRFASERCFNQIDAQRRAGKMLLGRLDSVMSKYRTLAYGFSTKDLTNADILLARKGAAAYKASRPESNPFA